MWQQLPRPAPDCEVCEQDQHELRVQQRPGGREGGPHPGQVEQGLHNQVCPPGAPEIDAPQGEHEAQPASRGIILLMRVSDVRCK